MNSTAIAKISLNALMHNLSLLRERMPNQKILAMVKSNAYGHGLVHAAKALSGADAFGIATISEALTLRAAAIKTDLVVMRGFTTDAELGLFLNDSSLFACIHDEGQVALLEEKKAAYQGEKLSIWLKVDTGMHRLGFSAEQFPSIYRRLMALPFIVKPFVIFSHLADADNEEATFTNQQIALFDTLVKSHAEEKSLLNSAGILAHANAHYDWIRPGLILYGVSPFLPDSGYEILAKDFKSAMRLESKLIAIKSIKAGEKIGYSCTYTAPSDMKIAIVGMGYGDGYPRHAQSGTPVLIRGQRCPIVGRISMDMMTVDVSHLALVALDDTVVLWGDDLPAAEIAAYVDTVAHELLCHLSGRVQMEYEEN